MNIPSLIVSPKQQINNNSINQNFFIDYISDLITKGYDKIKNYLFIVIIIIIVYYKRDMLMNHESEDEEEHEHIKRVVKKKPDEENNFEDIDSIIEEYNRQERLNSFYDDIIPKQKNPINEVQATSEFGTFDDYSEYSTILPPYA